MVNVVFEKDKNRAAAYDGDKEIGECTYSQSDSMWIIDHTYVDENYRGQDIAAKLVDAVVDAAREEGVRIIPLCPYAKRRFEEDEKYADVWKR